MIISCLPESLVFYCLQWYLFVVYYIFQVIFFAFLQFLYGCNKRKTEKYLNHFFLCYTLLYCHQKFIY